MPADSLRILIGEDDSVTALGLEQELRSLGHTVVGIAPDGATALLMARALGPDLIVLDVRMPHMTGLDAAERIHADRPVPIIIATAFSDRDTIARAATLPVFHYLVKPVSAGQLSGAIAVAQARHREWLEQAQANADLRRKLEERKVIERAKGILMEREGIAESAAYRMLQRTSQNRNISMAELSRSVLDTQDLVRTPRRAPAEDHPSVRLDQPATDSAP
ncbi:MAG: response regulator [Gemmatimonadaceae bacterium]